MIVTTKTSLATGGGGNPRKHVIMQQIRKLEKKKLELLKKLTNDGADATQSAVASGTVSWTPPSIPGGTAETGGGSQGESGGTASAFARVTQSIGMSSSQSMAVPELDEDPEEILKRVQLLDLQIMTLRQQLGDDAITTLAAVDEGEDAASLLETALEAISGASAPGADGVAPEGHVDEYA